MFELRASSINELYFSTVRFILANGAHVSPRGLPTLEVSPGYLVLTDPRDRLLSIPGRAINPAFTVAEAVWVLSGSNDPWIFLFNSKLREYTDNGVLQGAYGPRIRRWQGRIDQLDEVRKLLVKEPMSRQAVIQIFDPAIDYQGFRDVACTLGHHFLLRDGYLHMFTTMRSQDVWLGLPYDIFTNTLLQEMLAGWVGAKPGNYYHKVDSLHLYVRDKSAAERLEPAATPVDDFHYDLTCDWSDFDDTLRKVIEGATIESTGWRSFTLIMRSYRAWKSRDFQTAYSLAAQAEGTIGRALREWYNNRERRER